MADLLYFQDSEIHASCGFLRRHFIRDWPMSCPVWIQSGGTDLMRFLTVHTVFLFHKHFILFFRLFKFNFLCILLCVETPCTILILQKRNANGTFTAERAYMLTQEKKET